MYISYCIINKINQKSYIGVHETENINDNYMGSGKAIKAAIKKYGKENFYSFVLGIFEDKEDAYEFESFYVNDEFVSSPKTYNLKEGGFGSPTWTKEMKEAAKIRATGNTFKKGKTQLAWNKNLKLPNLCRPILDLSTGIFWESYKEAANVIGINPRTLRSYLDGTYKNKTALIKC